MPKHSVDNGEMKNEEWLEEAVDIREYEALQTVNYQMKHKDKEQTSPCKWSVTSPVLARLSRTNIDA